MISITMRSRQVFMMLVAAVCLVTGTAQAGNVRPLNLETIDGKPAAKGAEFTRLVHLLALNEFGPAYFDKGGTNRRDYLLCEIALENLTETAIGQVLTNKTRNTVCAQERLNRKIYYGWRGDNRLDREDSRALFEKQFLPEIMKAAAKVAAMDSLREFIYEGALAVNEGGYSREQQAFRINTTTRPEHLKDFLQFYARPVTEWPMPEAEARRFMSKIFERNRKSATLKTLTKFRLGRVVPFNAGYRIEAYTTDIRVYDKNDTDYARPLHHFGANDVMDKDAVARSKAPRIDFKGQSYLIAAYADLSGKGKGVVEELINSRNWGGGDPFRIQEQQEEERKRLSAALDAQAAQYSRNNPVWVWGTIGMAPYNMEQGYFPVRSIQLNMRFNSNTGLVNYVDGRFVDGQVDTLPVPKNSARDVAKNYAYIYRALVRPVEATSYRDDGSRSGKPRTLGQTVLLEILKMELLTTEQYLDIQYDGDVVWRHEPVAYAELKKRQAAEEKEKADSLAALRERCETTGSPDCYRELCIRISTTAGKKEYKACKKKLAAAMAREKGIKLNAALGAAAVRKEAQPQAAPAVKTNSRADCEQKYGGYQAQAWMPVPGSPEYKTAVKACLKQPVREPYGRDILGLRLGMTTNDVNRFIQRQSYERHISSGDSRPFEEAQLSISKDKSDGLAVFFLRNGNTNRVAGVSRRLYFKDGQMQAATLKQGLQKKYGEATWSQGDKTLMWLDASSKASPASCAGLVSMMEERGDWKNGGWVLKHRTSSAQRGRANMAIGMQAGLGAMAAQQECMSKYGMPTGGANMEAQIQELQRCIQEKMAAVGAGAEATADIVMADPADEERRPHMVKMTATPDDFARYKACGPVVIAQFNPGSGDSVKDLSLTLFDPEWISRQPGFAFKGEDGTDLRF